VPGSLWWVPLIFLFLFPLPSLQTTLFSNEARSRRLPVVMLFNALFLIAPVSLLSCDAVLVLSIFADRRICGRLSSCRCYLQLQKMAHVVPLLGVRQFHPRPLSLFPYSGFYPQQRQQRRSHSASPPRTLRVGYDPVLSRRLRGGRLCTWRRRVWK
jgi:hypothetical protein